MSKEKKPHLQSNEKIIRTIENRDIGKGNWIPETVFSKYRDQIYSYLLKKVRNKEDAEDLTQEVYIKIQEGWHSFHYENDKNLKAWVFQLAKNHLINKIRKDQRVQNKLTIIKTEDGFLHNQSDPDAGPEINVHDLQKLIEEKGHDFDPLRFWENNCDPNLFKIFESMGPDNLIVLTLNAAGYEYKEIAKKLNVPIGTVMSRLSRARKVVSESRNYSPPPIL